MEARWRELRGEPLFIRLEQLAPAAKHDDTHRYFKCPWCENADHYAMMSRDQNAGVIHCHISGHMAFVIGPDILGIIEAEELKFGKTLDHLKKMPLVLSAREAFEWITARGAPLEVVEGRCAEIGTLDEMLSTHQELSRKKTKLGKSIF